MTQQRILDSVAIEGSNFDVPNAQCQFGGRVLQYGFVHLAVKLQSNPALSADGITATHPGAQGGITGGLGMTVITAATADHDSVTLPPGAVVGGAVSGYKNQTQFMIDLYPQVGGTIDGMDANTPLTLLPGSSVFFSSRDDGSGGINVASFS